MELHSSVCQRPPLHWLFECSCEDGSGFIHKRPIAPALDLLIARATASTMYLSIARALASTLQRVQTLEQSAFRAYFVVRRPDSKMCFLTFCHDTASYSFDFGVTFDVACAMLI